MPLEMFEYKAASLGSTAAANGSLNLDEAQGIVECFVAGIGNRDSVGDICATGAFTKSLMRRKPRVVWGHNWNDPIGKVLEIYEVPPTDNRLPMKMKMAGIGGLFARVQFNLFSEKGKEAFSNVAFFGQEQEWSIGYKTLRAQYDQKAQANVIYELELYEVSPVLHGANQLTGTISVKSDGQSAIMENPQMSTPVTDGMDVEELEKQLSMMLGKKVSVTDVADNHVMYGHVGENGQNEKYKCPFMHNNGRFMFGAPMAMPMSMPTPRVQAPTVPMRPPAASVPMAFKPTSEGMAVIALPRVEYANTGNSNMGQQTPGNLDKEEADLRDALLKIVARHGKFNEDSEGVWAGYTPAIENEIARIGVKCSNCVFFQGEGKCKIIDMAVESEGKCRFAVIPPGVVNAGPSVMKSYRLDELNSEVEYLTDIEVKYPEDLAVVSLRGAIENKFLSRRKYKSLAEFSLGDSYDDKPYYIPVVVEHAFKVKQALDPIFDYHRVESFVDTEGIVLTSGVTLELIDAVDTALNNLKKKSLIEFDPETKAAGFRLGRAIGSRLIDRPTLGDRHLGDNRRNRSTDIDIPTGGVRGYRKPTFSTFDPDNDGWVDEGSTNPRFIGIQNALKPIGAPDVKPKDRVPSAKKPVQKLENEVGDSVAKISAPKSPNPDKKFSIPGKDLSNDYKFYLKTSPKNRSDEDRFKYDGPLAKLSSGQELDESSLKEMYDLMAKDFLASLEKVQNDPNSTWEFPWRRAMFFATNPNTKRTYEGTNQFLLMQVASHRGYEIPRWAGVAQWKKAGGELEPGYENKLVQIIAPTLYNGRPTGTFHITEVINVAEVKGLPEEFYKPISHDELDAAKRMKDIEDVISEIGPDWKEAKQGRAFYSPSNDSITMPTFSSFKDPIGFYSTLLHETTHWTGHPSRLNRDQTGRMRGAGAESKSRYAFEELIAEIGSAFAMGILGLEPTVREDHAQYVSGWMQAIRDNPNALQDALTQAQQAIDYMMNKSPTLRRLAGKRDDERKGRQDFTFTVPGTNTARNVTVKLGPPKKGEKKPLSPQAPFRVPAGGKRRGVVGAMSSGLFGEDLAGIPGFLIKDKDGNRYDQSYRKLSSGADLKPIVSKFDDKRIVKRSDAESARERLGLNYTPTEEQVAIIDTGVHFLEQPGGIAAVRAGAGTGKTTTLEAVSKAVQLEDPEAGVYYITFARKNAQEANGRMPENTGSSTINQLAYWSLKFGTGNKMFGPKTAEKVSIGASGGGNSYWGKTHKQATVKKTITRFDGTTVDLVGVKSVGYRTLGYTAFDKIEGSKAVVEKYKLDEIKYGGSNNGGALPLGSQMFDATQISALQYGAILNNALSRFCISGDETISAKHFEHSAFDIQNMVLNGGSTTLSPVVDRVWTQPVPDAWVKQLEQMWKDITDDNSNVLPTFDHQVKMWALTKPDLSTDPGLIGHASRDQQGFPKATPSGTRAVKGKTGIVTHNKTGATWYRQFGTKDKPLSLFMFDEAQDTNQVVQQVIADNAEKGVSIMMVGDPRQSIFGFRGSSDTFAQVKPTFELTLRDSFRYGRLQAYLGNSILNMLNIEDRNDGVDPEASDYQLFGRAAGVVEADFSIAGLSKDELTKKFQKLAKKYDARWVDIQKRNNRLDENIVSLSALPSLNEKDRDKLLTDAMQALAAQADGEILRDYKFDRPGKNMVIFRTNAGMISQGIEISTRLGKTLGMPEERHSKMLAAMKVLNWINSGKKLARPVESKLLGGKVMDAASIQDVKRILSIDGKANADALSLMRLLDLPKMNPDGTRATYRDPQTGAIMQANMSAMDYVEALEGMWDSVKGEFDYSKRKIIPVQERVDIDPFEQIDIEAVKIQGALNPKKSGAGANGPWIMGGLEPNIIIPASLNGDADINRVYWRPLFTDSGSWLGPGVTASGKWDGKSILITGNGVDGVKSYTAANGSATKATALGPSRLALQKWIKDHKMEGKISYHEKSVALDGKAQRPPGDGWVVSGDTLEESASIVSELGRYLTDHVNDTEGVDIEVITGHGVKGLEADYVMMGDDWGRSNARDMGIALTQAQKDAGEVNNRLPREEAHLLYVALTRAKLGFDPGPGLDWIFDPARNTGIDGIANGPTKLGPEQQRPNGHWNPYGGGAPKASTFTPTVTAPQSLSSGKNPPGDMPNPEEQKKLIEAAAAKTPKKGFEESFLPSVLSQHKSKNGVLSQSQWDTLRNMVYGWPTVENGKTVWPNGDATPSKPSTPNAPGAPSTPSAPFSRKPRKIIDIKDVEKYDYPDLPANRKPNPEQDVAIDAMMTGADVKVRALAATGKTTTVINFAKRLQKSEPEARIAYLVFNVNAKDDVTKRIAKEGISPDFFQIRTMDSLSYNAMKAINRNLTDKSYEADAVNWIDPIKSYKDRAAYLGIKGMVSEADELSAIDVYKRVQKAIDAFVISDDKEVGPQHFTGAFNGSLAVKDEKILPELVGYAKKMWEDINTARDGKKGMLPTNNAHLTKIWALTDPDIGKIAGANIAMVDEAQDMNPVFAKMLANSGDIQKIYIGDTNQAINAWRGADGKTLDDAKSVYDMPITDSYRFGKVIAGVGNQFLSLLGAKERMTGKKADKSGNPVDGVITTIDKPTMILTRANGGAIAATMDVFSKGGAVYGSKNFKKDLENFIQNIDWMENKAKGNPFYINEFGKEVKTPPPPSQDLDGITTMEEFKKAIEDGDNNRLNMLNKLLAENSVADLREALSKIITDKKKLPENRDDYVHIQTAHTSKGLESPRVKIWSDFRKPKWDKEKKTWIMPDEQELRLSYVAVTRAEEQLELGSLDWINDFPESDSGSVAKLSSGAASSNAGGRLSRRIRTVGNAGEDMSGAEGDTRRLAHPIELAGFSSVTKNSGTNRAITKTSMSIWKGFRDNGIALDIDSDSTDPAQKQKALNNALNAISERMRERPSIKIGNISQNGGNQEPSAETWMLPVSKLKDAIRVPTEWTRDYTDSGSLSESFHSQTRPITNAELASMLGLGRRDAALLEKDGAAINHDAVRYMLAETGKQKEFGAWRLFAPVDSAEAKQKKWNAEEVFAENIGRASMRDRFIVETFGKDAFPHWFDQEEQQSITPDEYASLGEVSPVAKFQAMGRFQKNSATDGDSEAEHNLMLEGMSGASLTPSGTVTAEQIATDKTSRQDFKIEPLLEHLGISKNDNWHEKLRQVIAESFGSQNVGLGSRRDAAEWEKKGVPVAYIDEMIRKGVIPDASSIWTEGKAGQQLDSELSRSKHAVYEALNEFIQKSGVEKSKANRETVHSIIGKKDIHTELPKLAATRGPVFSPKKGDSPRYSTNELQGVVNRFNEVFGTNYSIDDIFSAEQLRTARERIEKDGKTLYGKNKNGTRVISDSTAV